MEESSTVEWFKVPYGRKDKAKKLGLRWDSKKLLWRGQIPISSQIPKSWKV